MTFVWSSVSRIKYRIDDRCEVMVSILAQWHFQYKGKLRSSNDFEAVCVYSCNTASSRLERCWSALLWDNCNRYDIVVFLFELIDTVLLFRTSNKEFVKFVVTVCIWRRPFWWIVANIIVLQSKFLCTGCIDMLFNRCSYMLEFNPRTFYAAFVLNLELIVAFSRDSKTQR